MTVGARLRRHGPATPDWQPTEVLHESDQVPVQAHAIREQPGGDSPTTDSATTEAAPVRTMGHSLDRISVFAPGTPPPPPWPGDRHSQPVLQRSEATAVTREVMLDVPHRPPIGAHAQHSVPSSAVRLQSPAIGAAADAPTLSVQRIDTYTTPGGHSFTHTSGAAFAPALENTGAFAGAALKDEERQTRAGLEAEAQRRGDTRPVSDWKVRCEMLRPRIQEADIERARQQRALEAGGTGPVSVLGVFIAPEWYFKRAPVPYTATDRDGIIQAMAAMSTNYPKMVIVPGSIVWRQSGSGALFWRTKARMGNTAPVLFNGHVVKYVHKWNNLGDTYGYARTGENLDDASEAQMLASHGGTSHAATVKKANREYGRNRPTTVAQAGSSFFQIDNVVFSLEICGDHGRAYDELTQQGNIPFPAANAAHVELLISHGAKVKALTHTVREDTGVAYHADASVNAAGHEYGMSSAFTATKTAKGITRKVLEQVEQLKPGKDERILLGTYTL